MASSSKYLQAADGRTSKREQTEGIISSSFTSPISQASAIASHEVFLSDTENIRLGHE